MSLDVDVIIVGGGMAGVSLAYELADTCRVVLIEREAGIGYHATGRSAAMFMAGYGNAPVRALSRASAGFFAAPPAGITDTPLLRPRGALTIATEHQRDQLEAAGALLNEQRLDTDAARDLVPILRTSHVAHALFDPHAADIEVASLHQGYWKCARATGVIGILDCDPKIERHGNGWLVAAGGQIIRSPALANAAGAWADELARSCDVRLAGLRPRRRSAALVQPPAGQDIARWPLVKSIDESFYFKPDAGLLLISPADETPTPPCDVQPEEIDIAIGIDRFEQATSAQVRRVEHRWAGLRTFAPDRSPVVGFAVDDPSFFWFAGQGGYGIQMAPALARLGASLLLRRPMPVCLEDEDFDVGSVLPSRLKDAVEPIHGEQNA